MTFLRTKTQEKNMRHQLITRMLMVCAVAFGVCVTVSAQKKDTVRKNVATPSDVEYDVSLRIVDAQGENPGYEAIVRLGEKTLQVLEERADQRPDEMEKFGNVIQTDVNFDGHPDLLICLGGMNVTDQTFIYYDAWISNVAEGELTFSCYKNFRDISNAEVDAVKQRILSHYMARDGSFTYSALRWHDGKLEMDGKSWNVKKKLVIR